MVCGLPVNWVASATYLGIYLESSCIKCSFQSNKAKFYNAFYCIFGKIRRIASEEVIFILASAERHSLQFLLLIELF